MISKALEYLFPDTKSIGSGQLWLEKKRFYRDRWSSHDLWLIEEVLGSGFCFARNIPHETDWSPSKALRRKLPYIRRAPSCLSLKEIARSMTEITEDYARSLGYELNG